MVLEKIYQNPPNNPNKIRNNDQLGSEISERLTALGPKT
jgi:hypothetical protein